MSVLVIGSSAIDRFYDMDRLPSPKESMVAKNYRTDFGGKGLNQAVAAHRAGAHVSFVTYLGDDSDADDILSFLLLEGIDTQFVHRYEGPTNESLIFVDAEGENCLVATASSAKAASDDYALAAIEEMAQDDWLVMQGNLKRSTTELSLEHAQKSGLKTLLNPSPILFDHEGIWPLVDIAIVNEVEAEQLSGTPDLDRAARNLLDAGCEAVVITKGAKGASLHRGSGKYESLLPPVAAADTTGAGDVCCGTFVAGLDLDIDAPVALDWAVAAASLSVTRSGSGNAIPTADELADLRLKSLSSSSATS